MEARTAVVVALVVTIVAIFRSPAPAPVAEPYRAEGGPAGMRPAGRQLVMDVNLTSGDLV
jgi:hypothetical protein